MNIYRYKNCLKFRIWNCTLPQIDGHATCIFNIVTKEFRLFKYGTWGGLTWITPVQTVEITDITDEVRELVKKAVIRRIHQTTVWNIVNLVTGQIDDITAGWNFGTELLDSYVSDLFFLHDNYVGDMNEPEVDIAEHYDNWFTYCRKNLAVG